MELFPLVYRDYAQCGVVLQSVAAAGKASGAVTPEAADAWLAEQQERAKTGKLFVMVPMFIASATRP